MSGSCGRNERSCCDDADCCRPKSSSRGAEYAADCCPRTPVDTDPRRKFCKTNDPEESLSCIRPEESPRGRGPRSSSRGADDAADAEHAADCCPRTPVDTDPHRKPCKTNDFEKTPSTCPGKSPSRGRVQHDLCCVPTNDCADCDLTDYAKEYVANTGRLIQSCTCTKFNGLQDSCQHSGCASTIRTGCMDNPFPSCLPAQKWTCDFMYKNIEEPDER